MSRGDEALLRVLLLLPLRVVSRLPRMLLTLLLVAGLALNILTLTVSGAFTAASEALGESVAAFGAWLRTWYRSEPATE